MTTINCKVSEIKATDKDEVIVKFTNTSASEFAAVMGMMKENLLVTFESAQLQIPFDDEDKEAPDAPAEPAPLALEPGEAVDAEYEDLADVAAEVGPLDDDADGVEDEI